MELEKKTENQIDYSIKRNAKYLDNIDALFLHLNILVPFPPFLKMLVFRYFWIEIPQMKPWPKNAIINLYILIYVWQDFTRKLRQSMWNFQQNLPDLWKIHNQNISRFVKSF